MADDWGLMEQWEEAPCCPDCGQELDWIECDACGGEGEFDWETLQDEDPLWYGPDDTERCEQCGGAGGWHWCSNSDCPSKRDGVAA